MLEICCEEEEDKGEITTKKFEPIFFSGPTNYGWNKKTPISEQSHNATTYFYINIKYNLDILIFIL